MVQFGSILNFQRRYSLLKKEIPPTEPRLAGFSALMKGRQSEYYLNRP
jgi:hypothetical protein